MEVIIRINKRNKFSYQRFTQSNIFSCEAIDRAVDRQNATVGRFPGFQKKNVLDELISANKPILKFRSDD